MTTNNHTDISSGAAANAATINSPMGQLDAAIGDLTTLSTTPKTSVVAALGTTALPTTAKTISGAIAELPSILVPVTDYGLRDAMCFSPSGAVNWDQTTKILSTSASYSRIFYGKSSKHANFTQALSIDFSGVAGAGVTAYAYITGVTYDDQDFTNAAIHIENQSSLTHDITVKSNIVLATYIQSSDGVITIHSPFMEPEISTKFALGAESMLTPDYRLISAPGIMYNPDTKILSSNGSTNIRVFHGRDTKYITITDALSIDFSACTASSSWYYAYLEGVTYQGTTQNFTNSQIIIERHNALTKDLSDGDVIILAKWSVDQYGHGTLDSELLKPDLYMQFARGQFYGPKAGAWVNLYPQVTNRLSVFAAKLLGVADDINVILWGDSIFNSTYHNNADGMTPTEMPMTLYAKNLAWNLWTKALPYDKAVYRRYDHATFFTLGGTWTEDADTPLRATYSTDGVGSVAFTIPAAYTGCGYIYRSTTVCTEHAQIAVSEGDDYLEYWTGAAWAEANAAIFSQKATDTGDRSTGCIYQQRLYLRKTVAHYSDTVTVSIDKSDSGLERLYCWGVELYDTTKPLLRLINSAVGGEPISHLLTYMDDSIAAYSPDLVIFEIPLINEIGDVDADPDRICNELWDVVWGTRPGNTNTWALLQQAETSESGTWDAFQVVLVIPPHPRAHFNADGTWAVLDHGYTAEQVYAKVKAMIIARGDVGMIDLAMAQLRAIESDPDHSSNRYTALTATTVYGHSYSDDSTHPNDKGVGVLARHLCPVFDFNSY